MEWLVVVAVIAIVFGAFGSWVAVQKRRVSTEGFILGLLFGPLGVLVEALLPVGTAPSGGTAPGGSSSRGTAPGGRSPRGIDKEGMIAAIADRFRTALEEADVNWRALSYHRKRAILRSTERQIMEEFKLSPTAFADLAAEARRSLLLGPA